MNPPVVDGCPNAKGVPGLSAVFASLLANGFGESGPPKLKVDAPFGVDCPKGDENPFNFDSSGLLGVVVVLPRTGLSSIISTESSFLGGVTVLVAVGVPLAAVPNKIDLPAGVDVAAEAPKANLLSAVGVDGAVVVLPNANADLAGSGADAVDGWPKAK